MATYLYALITDSTETFTLADGSQSQSTAEAIVYALRPGIANQRANALGGRGEYEETVLECDMAIKASSSANVWAAYQKLKRLLDKADAWQRSNGSQGTAVLFKWSPVGGTTSTTSDPLQAVVLGRAAGDNTNSLTMPSDFPRGGSGFILKGVQLRIVRTGQWLLTTQAATHNTVTNGDLATLTFASSQNVASPTKIDLTNFIPSSESLATRGGYVVVSEVTNGINIINAEGMTATAFTSVADSANAARNTNVLRYTPTVTTEARTGGATVSIPSGSKMFAIYINAKTSNSAASFLVRGTLTNTFISADTNRINITDSSRDWYCLGQTSLNGTETSISVLLKITAASTSYTLDIDTVVLLCLDVGNPKVVTLANDYGLVLTTGTLSLDHRALTKPSPTVNFNSTYDYTYSYKDDPYISTSATAIYATFLSGGTVYWRQYSGGAATTNNWTATRYASYLTPV